MKLPTIGLGTYRLKGQQVQDIVIDAVGLGYKLIDTATVYKNEKDIGQALERVFASGVDRKDLFITTKISPRDQGYDKAYAAALKSLELLQLEYIDLLLIHWPGTAGIPLQDPKNIENRLETWRALEDLYYHGKCKHIGISNFNQEQLKGLLSSCRVKPMVHQFEFHPLYKKNLSICIEHGILPQAYSSFGEGQLLHSEQIITLSKQQGCTPAQLLLNWALEQNVAVIPKTSSVSRLKENLVRVQLLPDIKLAMDEMILMGEKKYCWDPDTVI